MSSRRLHVAAEHKGAAHKDADESVDAVVVGAGLAGLYALYRLRSMGYAVRVLEAGGDVGGTWFWNRYPGARCDVESVDYSYSFSADLEQEWTWTERYATQGEILRYIRHVAERFDLRPHISFGMRVTGAYFDEVARRWSVVTDQGRALSARLCVLATGALSAARVPDLPGLASFEGEWHHTGAWPRDGEPDFADRRVGVIGTGSSGIQIVPALADGVDELFVFQRTANFSMPAHNGPLEPEVMRTIKATYPERRRESRRTKRGFPVPAGVSTESALAFSAQERLARYERMWAHGGAIFTGTFADLTVNRAANETAAAFVRSKIREQVEEPQLANLLCPNDHPFATKRPCVDTDYYSTFNRNNVTLVDIRSAPVQAITPRGIRTARQHYDLDAIIFATGFDAFTGALSKIDIRGRGGVTLAQRWSRGPRAYLGLAIAGFPNLYLIAGPGSPSVLCNMVVSIEQHVEWLTGMLEYMNDRALDTAEAAYAAEEEWARHVNEIAAQTLLVEANSWYLGANIPGKPRVFMPYAKGMDAFEEHCTQIAEKGYEGFEFSR